MPATEEQLARLRKDAEVISSTLHAEATAPGMPHAGEPSALLRRVLSSASFGASEAGAEAIGLRPLEDPRTMGGKIAAFGADLVGSGIGGFGVGAPVRMGAKALLSRLAPRALAGTPRLARMGLGALENAAIGGTGAAGQGGDLGDVAGQAGLEGAMGGAMEGGMSVIGYLYSKGLRKVMGPKVPDKPDPTIRNPFVKRTYDEWSGTNVGLAEIAEREGVPVIVETLRPMDSMPVRLAIKVKYGPAMAQVLRDTNIEIERSVQSWKDRIVNSMRTTGPQRPRETGVVLQEQWHNLVDNDLRKRASKMYEDVLASREGSAWENIDTLELRQRLQKYLDDSGFEGTADPVVNRIRKVIARIGEAHKPDTRYVDIPVSAAGPTGGLVVPGPTSGQSPMDFNTMWRESQGLYPSKKYGWDEGDFAARDASRIIKDYIREKVALAEPQADMVFQDADQLWTRAHALEDSEFGKAMKRHPEQIVDVLTRDVTMLRQVRAEMSGEFVDQLAQRKVATMFEDAVNLDTGEIDAGRMTEAIERHLGGPHGNIQGEYLDELLATKPEVRKSLTELHGLLQEYDAARRQWRGASERALQPGSSEANLPGFPILMSGMDRAIVAVLNFAAGDKLAKLTTAPRKVNPLLRTTTNPALPDASAGPTLIRTLRRTAAAKEDE